MKQNYHAITLDKKDIGETDRLYTFYTRENGLMRVPARAVRKGEAKLASQVEDFVLSHITIAKGYGRGTLAGGVAEEYFVALHKNYYALMCVDKARSIFLSIIRENDSDENIFALFAQYLAQLNMLAESSKQNNCNIKIRWLTNAFLMQLFALQGYIFNVKHCCACQGKVGNVRIGFSIVRGGILCDKCLDDEKFCYIDPDTLKAMRIIQSNHIRSLSKVIVHDVVHRQLDCIVHDIEKWIMR